MQPSVQFLSEQIYMFDNHQRRPGILSPQQVALYPFSVSPPNHFLMSVTISSLSQFQNFMQILKSFMLEEMCLKLYVTDIQAPLRA